MEVKSLSGEGLSELMQQAGQTCLTILCPLHPANPDRSTDRLSLKHLAQQAALLIKSNWPQPVANRLQKELELMLDQLDLVRPPKGIGIYLNQQFHRIDAYPFSVPPLVYVDDRFPVREQIWYTQIQRPYYVLSLSEHSMHVVEVRDGDWQEIRDHFFPHKVVDEFEYAKPTRSSSYAGHAHVKIYERDKSELAQTRLRSVYRLADDPLGPYLRNGEPLILAGTERDMSLFNQVTRHSSQVIAQVNGNYQAAHQELFHDKIMHVIHDHQHVMMQRAVSDFLEKWGSGRARCGLYDCWQAVEQGKGLQLLVERGYREPSYLSAGGHFSNEPSSSGDRHLPDAVDLLMEMTLQKGGSVFLVDNNLLSSARRLALVLRYP